MRRAVERGPDYDPEIGPDPHRDKPRKASKRGVAGRLNRLAVALNFAHEELAELRHDLRVAESFAGDRPSFPIRCMGLDEREP